jgi:hypothetical protein
VLGGNGKPSDSTSNSLPERRRGRSGGCKCRRATIAVTPGSVNLEFGQDKHWLSIYYRTEDPTYLIVAAFIYRVYFLLLPMDGYFFLTVALTLAFSAGVP